MRSNKQKIKLMFYNLYAISINLTNVGALEETSVMYQPGNVNWRLLNPSLIYRRKPPQMCAH